MTPAIGTAFALGALTSLALAVAAVYRPPRERYHWSFAAGMVMFTAESVAAFVLVATTESPEDRLLWLRVVTAIGLALPLPWGAFVASLLLPVHNRARRMWTYGVLLGSVAAAGGVVAASVAPMFLIWEGSGAFYAARLETPGSYAIIAQLVATAAILGGLEAALRASTEMTRWRVKYVVLGVGGIFLVRFYLLGQAMLFHVVLATYLATGAVTLTIGNLVLLAAFLRHRFPSVNIAVSRHIVYRSAIIGILGTYLFIIGALGWVLNQLGVSEELFWGSLVIFLSALGLAAVFLSEHVRWRLKRFIGLNFYRSKYDYRQQWTSFNKRLGSLVTVDELAPALLQAVTEAVGTAKAALYIADGLGGDYHAVATRELGALPGVAADHPLPMELFVRRTPVVHGRDSAPGLERLDPELETLLQNGGVAVPLLWRGDLTGFLLIGRERTGAAYTVEDHEFLATVGEQAAGAIATARLSEAMTETRQFDAFNRVASFVIHDLKNSIAALSMLSQNAAANFDDPEFQRDAMTTLSRTVERMNGLLARLSSAPESAALHLGPVDVAALALEAAQRPVRHPSVNIVTEITPVPTLTADHEALLRVAQNLVKNAVEAVNGAGIVTVRVYADGDDVVLAVSDTGCGMSDEFVRKSLFTPFRSTKKAGWGIGMYQSKGIVDAHRGRIEVSSKEGEGTTFWVKLPTDRR